MAGLITVLAVLAVALYVCWLLIRPFFDVLMWAAVLSVVFYPMHRRILQRIGSPSLAAALSTIAVVLLILLPSTFITVAVVRELTAAAAAFQNPDQSWSIPIPPLLAGVVEQFGQYVNLDLNRETVRQFLSERMERWGSALAGGTLVVVGGAVGAVVQTLLVVFTLFYFFRDGERIRQSAADLVPFRRAQWRDIVVRTKEVIGATVYGVLVISAIQGSLGTFIFSVLGLPSPLLWGVVMFFLCMIPMAGAPLVWVPSALYLLLTGEYVRAGLLVGWGVLVIGAIDNFLSPRLVGQRARLHELLIFFAVLGGLDLFGVLGLVLGPVSVALTLALIEMAQDAGRPQIETGPEITLIDRPRSVRDAS
jgi:predicted PurR-regulated permease PerM